MAQTALQKELKELEQALKQRNKHLAETRKIAKHVLTNTELAFIDVGVFINHVMGKYNLDIHTTTGILEVSKIILATAPLRKGVELSQLLNLLGSIQQAKKETPIKKKEDEEQPSYIG